MWEPTLAKARRQPDVSGFHVQILDDWHEVCSPYSLPYNALGIRWHKENEAPSVFLKIF